MCNVACDGIMKVEIEISGDFGCLTKKLAIAEHGGLRARLLPLSAVARSPARARSCVHPSASSTTDHHVSLGFLDPPRARGRVRRSRYRC